MKKIILLITVLNIWCINGQKSNNNQMFIVIEKGKHDNLYLFDNDDIKANIKVLYYDSRKEGFISKKKSKLKEDIIVVKSEPSTNYYEFNSQQPPEMMKSISGLKVYSIEDVSKNNMELFQNNQQYFFFIEIMGCEKYRLWKMKLEIIE